MSNNGRFTRRAGKTSGSTVVIVLAVVGAALLMMCMVGGVLIALLLPAVQQAREAARRTQSKNNIKQIALASHNFHDTYGHFPPFAADGSESPDVTAQVSFLTAVLPFMEQAPLYGTIDKSVAWDDPKNQAPYSSQIAAYLSPQFEERTGPTGYALTHYAPNSHLIEGGPGLAMAEISDGTSYTVLSGGINAAFPAWGDPRNARDPANGFRGGATAFGGTVGGALIGMADGSVRFVSENTSPDVAAALATPDGGEDLTKVEF